MRKLTKFSSAFIMGVLATSAAFAERVQKPSAHSVEVTMDRLEDAVNAAGATVFARVDHAAGAAKVDMQLAPATLLIFGNPKLGTPAMQTSPTAGLDLPMRVLAFEDNDGNAILTYHSPASFAETHGLPTDAEYIRKMTGALDMLTNKAASAE